MTAARNLKCPSCGGELVFDPSTQQYACPYCGSHFDQRQLDEILKEEQQPSQDPEAAAFDEENSFADARQQEEAPQDGGQEAVVYRCPSCGAEILTDETTAATFCCFCHNPVILEGRISGKFLPDRVIPFTISRQEAVEKFLAAMKKKWFVRKGFFQKDQIEKLTGVYLPCWDADWEGDAALTADATRVRVWRSGDTEFTETRFYRVIREGHLRFKGLTKNALKKADQELAEGVHPYRQQEKKPFSIGYLSGFQAERRDVEWEEVQPQMQSEARTYTERLLQERARLEKQFAQLQEAPAAPDAKEEFLKKVRTVYDIIGNPEIENDTKGVFIRSIVEEIIYDKEKDTLTFRLYSPQKPA